MPLQLEDLEPLGSAEALAPAAAAGAPLLLAIDTIDEDPSQPRREFDANTLQELADTIAERGVRQPISVRRHPREPGRWMLNFGARRLRASKLAGKTLLPAFVDESADSYDQVIENEQRDGLKPLELALFVQRRMAAGDSQADIARRLGKSRQYVMIATALIDPPDWLMAAYREGRCRGLNELHEVRKLHSQRPQYVEAWASGRETITRERVQALRTALADVRATEDPAACEVMKADALQAPRADGHGARPAARSDAVACKQRRRRLQASLDGSVVWIVTDAAPDEPGRVFVQSADAPSHRDIAASRLTLLGFGTD